MQKYCQRIKQKSVSYIARKSDNICKIDIKEGFIKYEASIKTSKMKSEQ